MNEWLLIFLMALVTFLPRYLPFALAGRLKIPNTMEQALGFVPIAVLMAIIAQTALVRDGSIDLTWGNHHALATLVAFVVAVWTRHLFATIGVGLLVFDIIEFVLRISGACGSATINPDKGLLSGMTHCSTPSKS